MWLSLQIICVSSDFLVNLERGNSTGICQCVADTQLLEPLLAASQDLDEQEGRTGSKVGCQAQALLRASKPNTCLPQALNRLCLERKALKTAPPHAISQSSTQ